MDSLLVNLERYFAFSENVEDSRGSIPLMARRVKEHSELRAFAENARLAFTIERYVVSERTIINDGILRRRHVPGVR